MCVEEGVVALEFEADDNSDDDTFKCLMPSSANDEEVEDVADADDDADEDEDVF